MAGARQWQQYEGATRPRRLVRIGIASGWAIHGILLEYEGNLLDGILLANSGESMPLAEAQSRGVGFQNVDGADPIVRVSGHHTRSPYLCHSIQFHFASGRVVQRTAGQADWRGRPFNYAPPQGALPYWLFAGLRSDLSGIVGERTAIHLPLTQELYQVVAADTALLPPRAWTRWQELWS